MEWVGWWCRVREISRAYFKHYHVRVCASTASLCVSRVGRGCRVSVCGVWSPKFAKTLRRPRTAGKSKKVKAKHDIDKLKPNPQVNPQNKTHYFTRIYIYIAAARVRRAAAGSYNPCHEPHPRSQIKLITRATAARRAAPRRATRAAPCVTHAEYTQRALLSDRRPLLCGGQR